MLKKVWRARCCGYCQKQIESHHQLVLADEYVYHAQCFQLSVQPPQENSVEAVPQIWEEHKNE